MYDLKKLDSIPFVEKELTPGCYQMKEILGELYITSQEK